MRVHRADYADLPVLEGPAKQTISVLEYAKSVPQTTAVRMKRSEDPSHSMPVNDGVVCIAF